MAMRGGYVDVVQVIYNFFEQEPATELLPVARECGVGILARVPFDEGVLTGKYETGHVFPENDFRSNYFAGDRLDRAVARAGEVEEDLAGSPYTLVQGALRFVLDHPSVSTLIPGMRNRQQTQANCAVSDMPAMSPELMARMRRHNWRRAFWYAGK